MWNYDMMKRPGQGPVREMFENFPKGSRISFTRFEVPSKIWYRAQKGGLNERDLMRYYRWRLSHYFRMQMRLARFEWSTNVYLTREPGTFTFYYHNLEGMTGPKDDYKTFDEYYRKCYDDERIKDEVYRSYFTS